MASTSGEVKIVSVIPPELSTILLKAVKTFYSPEQAIIAYYVMQSVCISEDNLKRKIGLDHKLLRQLSVPLKQDKLLRERLIQQKSVVTGRTQSLVYYFINYRAITNVFKYKLDHMRQRLEEKARAVVQKAAYRCTNCAIEYDTMQMDRIMNMDTGELECMHCRREVVQQDIASKATAQGLMAHFNVQMRPLLQLLQELDGVQLAPHLYEPDFDKFLIADQENAVQQAEKSQAKEGRARRSELGGKAFSADNGLRYRNADEITVNMNAGDTETGPVAKAIPAWLQSEMAEETEEVVEAPTKDDTSLALHELAAIENDSEDERVPKRPRMAEESEEDDESMEAVEKSDEDEEEGEGEMISVQGKMVPLEDVTQEMVEAMDDSEKEQYVQARLRVQSEY